MSSLKRYFIQYMLQNGSVSEKAALKYCSQIKEGNIDSLKQLVSDVNRDISRQNLKISCGVCEVTKEEVVVLLNTKSDSTTELQHFFTPIQLEYFETILVQILNAEDHRITFLVCINLAATLSKTLSREQGQNVIKVWIKGGYFVQVDGYVYLGLRTILEFASYLRTNCPNNVCKLCSELVFKSQICPHCSSKFHEYCIEKYLSIQSKCPSCESEWSLGNTDNRSQREEPETSVTYENSHSQNMSVGSDTESFTEEPGTSKRRKPR